MYYNEYVMLPEHIFYKNLYKNLNGSVKNNVFLPKSSLKLFTSSC